MSRPTLAAVAAVALFCSPGAGRAVAPEALDDAITVERFAEHPKVVNPVGTAVDASGRVYVVESHTHARPDGYDGPEKDRVRVLEDRDGDGHADAVETFYKGLRLAVDVEVGPKGWVYVVSRYAIHRLKDRDGDRRADAVEKIVELETTGTDPHDGLHGLSFGFDGWLHFGLGENGGKDYTLRGTDGVERTGGNEGGSFYRCRPDGTSLTRLAQGFWNPVGSCVGVYQRVFVVDNDPDSSPPCRLLHIVPGGRYGFAYRYGRSGLHPLQAWNGELPGALPMAQGTGEAPTDVVAYESDALPRYRGNLLVTSWADNRVQAFQTRRRGASVAARPEVLVRGPSSFRPTGLAVAPDGSLYVSDWVSARYSVDRRGRIWRIRPTDPPETTRPSAPAKALRSPDRATRVAAAKALLRKGREDLLRRHMRRADAPRVRAAALLALAKGERSGPFEAVANGEGPPPLRVLAAEAAMERGTDPSQFAGEGLPAAVRAKAIRSLRLDHHRDTLLDALASAAPYLRTAAIEAGRRSEALVNLDWETLDAPAGRAAICLAMKRSGRPDLREAIPAFLEDPSPVVRLCAVKWVADQGLTERKGLLRSTLRDAETTVRLFRATVAALRHLEGKPPRPDLPPGPLVNRAFSPETPPALRRMAVRLLPPSHEKVTVERLGDLLDHERGDLRLAAVRTLQRHPDRERVAPLADVATDASRPTVERAEAVVGLAPHAADHVETLMALATGGDGVLRKEALRALVGVSLSEDRQAALRSAAPASEADAVKRILGDSWSSKPAKAALDAWVERTAGEGDPTTGRRIFFHPKVGTCGRCHRVAGRGRRVGPDLTRIGRRATRRSLLEAIVHPARHVAPGYRPWEVVLADGTRRVGLPLRKGGHGETYRTAEGELFTVDKEEIRRRRLLETSLMPAGLAKTMTTEELRHLLAFLLSRR